MSYYIPGILLSNNFGASSQPNNHFDTNTLNTYYNINYHARNGAKVVTGMNASTGQTLSALNQILSTPNQDTYCNPACLECIISGRLEGYNQIKTRGMQCPLCHKKC